MLDFQLARDAMDNAINRYQLNTDNSMIHSDQETQYSSKDFFDYCNKNNITQIFANYYEVVQNVSKFNGPLQVYINNWILERGL